MSRHFFGVSFPSDQGVTVTSGINSITIPDRVNVAPVIGNITIPGGVSHCTLTCEEQRRQSLWGCLYTSRSRPNVISNQKWRKPEAMLPQSQQSHIPSHGSGSRAQP